MLEKSGNFVSPEKWEPWCKVNTEIVKEARKCDDNL